MCKKICKKISMAINSHFFKKKIHNMPDTCQAQLGSARSSRANSTEYFDLTRSHRRSGSSRSEPWWRHARPIGRNRDGGTPNPFAGSKNDFQLLHPLFHTQRQNSKYISHNLFPSFVSCFFSLSEAQKFFFFSNFFHIFIFILFNFPISLRLCTL